ncbi:type II toxin-antitoxin system RelB/DinJ family antitoxin [Limosilactobacillus reuteri]|uniref:type II toxin-antitoxin system RelB/DinJ family antitoxin n=1 Tax=Limosilactobacillus reuteri TaxID=1598 RepID=UPI00128BEEF9|nr:type II toxin-antitoxin system RelB/DinJ family antitoxin [Limosilactobacillus reuteri]MQB58124.1 damage-inducible protein [Limosilactobacillus reuteri]MQC03548.1 damage-inducible protein [Limosilactobacillus reuteri]
MSAATKSKKIQSRVQTNVDSKIKERAENVIKEVGLTPTAVINELQEAIKNVPVKKLRTKKEIEDFFNNED